MSTYESLMVMIGFANLVGLIMTWVLSLITFIFTLRKKDTHPVYITVKEKCLSEDPRAKG
ncbi:Toxic peptide TxpA [Bacillus sp. FSL M7-1004]|uniref:Toxic peptide TxpA n=1 Tax=Bacillus sp. FSL M7-1004 TaxID=2921539 RepID=UPI0030FC4406